MRVKRLSHVEIVVILLIAGVLLAILIPMIRELRQGSRRYACVENLKQLAVALGLYASENKDRYPPIDDTKNNFIFNANLLYPEYLSDHMVAVCPADSRVDPEAVFRLISDHPNDGTPKGNIHSDCFTDDNYIYLGWLVVVDQFDNRMLMSGKGVEAFFDAYDKLSPDDHDSNVNVPEGRGFLDGDGIYRLSCSFDIFLIGDINTTLPSMESGGGIVPFMWDRPYVDPSKFSHQPTGGNVLYMDGHVDFIKFGKVFPMTETMASLLDERARKPISHCE
jgi:prepilin-type processing-associated H-X9-DG protein